jgi:hypothetical protein
LNPDGLFEMCVESHTGRREMQNRSVRGRQYYDDVEVLWDICGDVFPRGDFEEVPLTKAKANLWKKRGQLKDEVRYSDLTVRNDHGLTQRMATGDIDSDLSSDKIASESVDHFFDARAYCDRSNIFFRRRKGKPIPSREIHTLLAGRVNEFAVPARCSKDDYGYVLGRLLHHNK